VSIDVSGLEEGETEEQAVRNFMGNLSPDDCEVEVETDDKEAEEEIEEADEK
jgi:hypothetical protein